VSDPGVEVARQAWAEAPRAARRVRAGLDTRGLEGFERALGAVHGELVRRVGQTFTLAELATAWREADRWAPDVVRESARSAAAPRHATLLVDLACARLERVARDARP
jgi:hypothetical protein